MSEIKKNKKQLFGVIALFATAFAIRAVCACLFVGFKADFDCFYCWALRIFEIGPTEFYADDYFSDYPPGYLYVLYPIGAMIKLSGCKYLSAFCLFVVKLPAMICDILVGALVYRYALKRNCKAAIIPAFLWLFDPAVIHNSAVWGQVDSVFTLAVTVMCILLSEKKTIPAYFAFAAGILIKPQTLIFTPLVLLGIYENVFRGGVKKAVFLKNLLGGLTAVAAMFAAMMPFGVGKVIKLYIKTMGSYPYASVNAYNFWSMIGRNWTPQDDIFFGAVTYKMIGSAVIPLICVFAAVIFIKNIDDSDRYWITGAFIIITMFLFSVRMHERYIFPVMIFLLMAYIENKEKDTLMQFIVFSLLIFLNAWHVLEMYSKGTGSYYPYFVCIVSALMLLTGISFYRSVFVRSRLQKNNSE